jgi:peroxiredoxin
MHQSIVGSVRMLVGLMGLSAVAMGADIPGPAVGERFPHELGIPDQSGNDRTLESLMGEKGLALFFVRSADWCPFCQRQLVEINQRVEQFRALGLNVVSVSVDDVAEIAAFAKEQAIEYTMLADRSGEINLRLGIRDEQYPVGSAAFGVPRPIVYIVDRGGTIRARYMEPTYRTRPNLDVVLREVAGLGH